MPTPQRSYSTYKKSFRFSSAYSTSRGKNDEGKAGIPGEEKPLLFALALLVITLPWMAAVEAKWTPFAGLAIAAACFLLALVSRRGGRHHSHTGSRGGFGRLIHFPVFYAGVCLLAYIAVQELNPAVTLIVEDGRTLSSEPIDHIEWLPSGTLIPSDESPPFKVLLLVGTPFLAVCAFWTGVSRRRSVLLLCRILCINGLLLAGLGLIQSFLGAEKILWIIGGGENPFFFSSFAHRTDAAAYFALILGLTAGIALFSYYDSRRRIERSSSSGAFLAFAIVLYIATLFTFSPGGFLAGTVVVASLAAAFVYPLFIERESEAKRSVFLVLTPLAILLVTYLAMGTVFEPMSRQFDQNPGGVPSHGASYEGRQSGPELLAERWLFGWGPGSFTSTASGIRGDNEQQDEPESFAQPLNTDPEGAPEESEEELIAGASEDPFKPHPLEVAFSNFLSIPIALGAAGTSLLIFILGFSGWQLIRFRAWRHPLAAFIVLGTGLATLPGAAGPLIKSPAIFTTWCLFLAIAVVLLRTERLPKKKKSEVGDRKSEL